MSDFTLIFSLLSLGFFGGFSHCIGMCGPFVISQVSSRLQDVALEKFSNFERLKNLALLPYQLGRVTTYCAIGFSCSALGSIVRNFDIFRYVSATFMLIAALVFLQSAINKKLINLPNLSPSFLQRLHLISSLFKNPRGLRGYLLGIILGFIPCGLLYGAFAICVTIPNPFLAAFAMLCFGASTFPSLFLSGSGGYLLIKHSGFKFVTKAVLLLNAIMLLMMAFRLF